MFIWASSLNQWPLWTRINKWTIIEFW